MDSNNRATDSAMDLLARKRRKTETKVSGGGEEGDRTTASSTTTITTTTNNHLHFRNKTNNNNNNNNIDDNDEDAQSTGDNSDSDDNDDDDDNSFSAALSILNESDVVLEQVDNGVDNFCDLLIDKKAELQELASKTQNEINKLSNNLEKIQKKVAELTKMIEQASSQKQKQQQQRFGQTLTTRGPHQGKSIPSLSGTINDNNNNYKKLLTAMTNNNDTNNCNETTTTTTPDNTPRRDQATIQRRDGGNDANTADTPTGTSTQEKNTTTTTTAATTTLVTTPNQTCTTNHGDRTVAGDAFSYPERVVEVFQELDCHITNKIVIDKIRQIVKVWIVQYSKEKGGEGSDNKVVLEPMYFGATPHNSYINDMNLIAISLANILQCIGIKSEPKYFSAAWGISTIERTFELGKGGVLFYNGFLDPEKISSLDLYMRSNDCSDTLVIGTASNVSLEWIQNHSPYVYNLMSGWKVIEFEPRTQSWFMEHLKQMIDAEGYIASDLVLKFADILYQKKRIHGIGNYGCLKSIADARKFWDFIKFCYYLRKYEESSPTLWSRKIVICDVALASFNATFMCNHF